MGTKQAHMLGAVLRWADILGRRAHSRQCGRGLGTGEGDRRGDEGVHHRIALLHTNKCHWQSVKARRSRTLLRNIGARAREGGGGLLTALRATEGKEQDHLQNRNRGGRE
mmetsp:Transcript_11531/g.22131  ORF Transcript_11531/g.22131 Transcript_11531/m.22131 type:complete len:110 (+) Transcript_11531:132-461(+)